MFSRSGTTAASRSILALALSAAGAAGAAGAEDTILDPLVQVSGGSPFTSCTADLPHNPGGTVFTHSEVEPYLATNPLDSLNLVATWQQDRWSNGGARGLSVGVTLDGGLSWEPMVIPGLTLCSGGFFVRASDPWVTFGADGTVHLSALVIDSPSTRGVSGIAASRSHDGGLSWEVPVNVAITFSQFDDKESITADPSDPNMVYVIWDRLSFRRGPAMFSRSSNGGRRYAPAKVLHDPGIRTQTIGGQIVVAPSGTLFAFFNEIISAIPNPGFYLAFKSSGTQGTFWHPANASRRIHRIFPMSSVNPDTGQQVRDGSILFDAAVDRRSGNLYLVWQDGSLSGFELPVIAFSMSRNNGLSWTSPVAINKTPEDLERLERQALLPTVYVTDDGTVGVSYYDFRFNTGGPGALTDRWLIWCHPGAVDCAAPSRWRSEIRLTDDSFDVGEAPVANGLFLGDYMGLSASGDDFVALYAQPHDGDPSSAFFRRVILVGTADPEDLGYWMRQVRVAVTGRGRAEISGEELLGLLGDIHAAHDLFDDAHGLQGLFDLFRAPPTWGMAGQVRRHLLALMLNLASGRISPSVDLMDGVKAVDLVAELAAVVEDPASSHAALVEVKDLAERINAGEIPLD
jgi:hypothetical protein